MIKKKLIEVAIPLEKINEASAREKSVRHGHPSTLHLYWARRPLAACRAVLFAQLVDDPSAHPNKFPTKDDQDKERKRLFELIEQLVRWENSNNQELLKKVNEEILKSSDSKLPSVHDPFSGGCAIPLEAQRLGLKSFGSDLNPVAVIIGKSISETLIPFKGMKPIHPNVKQKLHYENVQGLAEDVNYYGNWIFEKLFKLIGKNYPEINLSGKYESKKITVVAWIWARTVPSPDPAFNDVSTPLVSSFVLSSKKGKEAFIFPKVDKSTKTISYELISNERDPRFIDAKMGTKTGRGANFKCLYSAAAITPDYVKKCGQEGKLNQSLIAIIGEGSKGKVIIPPNKFQENKAKIERPLVDNFDIKIPEKALGYNVKLYGINFYSELFTNRQLKFLTTYLEILNECYEEIINDTKNKLEHEMQKVYANQLIVYLTFLLNQIANHSSSLCGWNAVNNQMRSTFSMQTLSMNWDFAEVNPFSNSSGSFNNLLIRLVKGFETLAITNNPSSIFQSNAQDVKYQKDVVISTDPPYYDNIGYADLSDFFYLWLKPALKKQYQDLFSGFNTPKGEELIATPFRHSSKKEADNFFLNGMKNVFLNILKQTEMNYPMTVYYAFKQSEIENEGISSTGWATFLEAIFQSGFAIVGTWPMRTEKPGRIRGIGANALANSVVLVCRKREETLGTITRAEFVRQLKTELPKAIADLKSANISPADIPQSSIGPGIGIFSRYQAVLENDDSHMSVKTALQLINRELGDEEGEYDSETSFAITWFEQNGFNVGDSGSAINIANAKGISINTLVHSGVAQSSGGKFSLLNRESLEDDWNPTTDKNLTIWECCQHLIKTMEDKGEFETAKLMKRMGSGRADSAKELAYTLYDIAANKRKDANEATAYNGLIAVWSELTAQASNITEEDLRGDAQMRMI